MRTKTIFTILLLFFFTFTLSGLSLAGEREDDRQNFKFDNEKFDKEEFDEEGFFEEDVEDIFFVPKFFVPKLPIFVPKFFEDRD